MNFSLRHEGPGGGIEAKVLFLYRKCSKKGKALVKRGSQEG